MRKLATTALTALTISLMGSAAAFADAPSQGYGYNNQYNAGPMNPQPGAGGPGAPRGNGGQWNQGPQGPQPPQGGPQGQWDHGPQGQWDHGPQDGQFGDHRNDDDHFGGERGQDDRFGDRRFDDRFDGRRFGDDRRFNRNFDFRLQFGNFDRWERGWGYGNYGQQYRYHQQLNSWQMLRRLEAQGYYGVRNLQKARWGFGYRAFGFNYRGQPVMLRVNPYTGRVLDVRYI